MRVGSTSGHGIRGSAESSLALLSIGCAWRDVQAPSVPSTGWAAYDNCGSGLALTAARIGCLV
jgi:hypothetical protein